MRESHLIQELGNWDLMHEAGPRVCFVKIFQVKIAPHSWSVIPNYTAHDLWSKQQ